MSRFVLDTSVALAWCFEDKTSPAADKILDALAGGEALAPAIWPVEVANALLVGERRKRITAAAVAQSLELLGCLNIHIDQASVRNQELVALARSQGLTAYDAMYLALAMREGIPLATLDRDLAKAARRTGVGLLG